MQQRGCALHLQLALATSPEVVEAVISPLGRPRLVVALLPQSSLYFPLVGVVLGSRPLVVADEDDVARQLRSVAEPAEVLERHLLSPGLADVDAPRDDHLHLFGRG